MSLLDWHLKVGNLKMLCVSGGCSKRVQLATLYTCKHLSLSLSPFSPHIAGGADRDVPVHVGALRPGGVAEKYVINACLACIDLVSLN